MGLSEMIASDLNVALKARETVTVSALRFLIAHLQNVRIERGGDLTDEEVVAEIAKVARKHQESIEAFTRGSRADLVDKETAQLAVLQKYLPKMLTQEEVTKLVEAAIASTGAKTAGDLGRVIGAVMGQVGPKADGAMVARIVKEKLTD